MMKMLLLRPSQGVPKAPDRIQPITASGWSGLAVEYDPLTGPATSDVTFTVGVAGRFLLAGYTQTGWTVRKNGTVLHSEASSFPYADVIVAVGDLIRLTSQSGDFAAGDIEVWIE